MATAFCPDCEGSVNVGPKPRLGERITCPHCEADLEVVELSPLELEWVYDEPKTGWIEQEDEEDEEDEDDWDEEWDEEDNWDDDEE